MEQRSARKADGKDGKPLKRIHQVYHDFNDFSVSTTGADGIRDDLNYIEDIELPVKKFLEDPANALPDGTLLKDHILYIVVVHGMPKVVESQYGIARGVTGSLGNWGDGSSLQQRLMMMYYDVTTLDFRWQPAGRMLQQQRLPGGAYPAFTKYHRQLNRRDGVQPVFICNTLSFTLVGQYNPYMHPETFHPGMTGLPDMNDQEPNTPTLKTACCLSCQPDKTTGTRISRLSCAAIFRVRISFTGRCV